LLSRTPFAMASFATLFLVLLVGPASLTSRTATASDEVALHFARAKARSAHPDPVPGFATVSLTPDSLTAMMQQDLAVNQRYLGWLQTAKGDGAVQAFTSALSAPYLRRIDAMHAMDVDHDDITIPVVTVWGALTFSTRSYDPSFGPMDPVSVLFVGDASPDRVYGDMTNPSVCDGNEGCSLPIFQDDKGLDLTTGSYQCPSSTQWVLMGNSGESLQWHPSVHGIMRAGDKCAAGQRDHMRLFGAHANAVFGAWSVGTPHQEQWMSGPSKYGHQVQSWTDARDVVGRFFTGSICQQAGPDACSHSPSVGLAVPFAGEVSTANGGVYQNVPFDGETEAFEICSCS